jgi:hypothetical protein
MKLKYIFIFLILLFFNSSIFSQITTDGIKKYVSENSSKIIVDFEKFFHVRLPENIDFIVDRLQDYDEKGDKLGLCYPEINTIIISEDPEDFIGYSLKISDIKNITSSNKFIRGTLIHELCHIYLNLVVDSLTSVHKIYRYPYLQTTGSKFIEEGICEYASYKLEEIFSNESVNENYGMFQLKKFLDDKGFSNGVVILLTNDPPTEEEISKPEKYFKKFYDIERK